jgi:hypothetical protein
VVDADHLESAPGRRVGGIARSVDRGSECDGLAELAAVDLAAFEVFDETAMKRSMLRSSLTTCAVGRRTSRRLAVRRDRRNANPSVAISSERRNL